MHEELKLDNQICFRLYTASRLITQVYTPMLNELGITYPQYLVMMVLWEQDSQPVNDIAGRLLLETNTVTPLLQRMEKLGFVARNRSKKDKRVQIVSLTEKGRALEEQAFDIVPPGLCKALDISLANERQQLKHSIAKTGSQKLKSSLSRQKDFMQLAGQLDFIINLLKKKD